MIYYKLEYFNIPPPSNIQFPTPPVKFDEGPGFTWVLGSRVGSRVRVPGPGFTYSPFTFTFRHVINKQRLRAG